MPDRRWAAVGAIALGLAAPVVAAQSVPDERLAADVREGETASSYSRMKKQIADELGLSFSMDISIMNQVGGTDAAVQAVFTPNVTWQAFSDTTLGSGSFQFSYLAAQYWSAANAATLAANLGLNSPINAWPANEKYFKRVTYRHEFPGRWLSVTLGQYPFSSFDGNAYANDQQVSFISNSLSQNGSQNYTKAGLGAYLQLDPTDEVTLAAGFNDSNDPTGGYIRFDAIGQGSYAWFLYGAWSPDVGGPGKQKDDGRNKGQGRGQYRLLYYNLPGVPARPRASDGLSFSASQPIGSKWGLFLRANTAWNSSFPVQSSVAAGAVYNDPLGRDPLDRIGIGFAWNRTNLSRTAAALARPSETMIELYWNWAVRENLLLTPNLQLYLQPALAPTEQIAAVFTLRITKLF